jgi:cardiolipin synthase
MQMEQQANSLPGSVPMSVSGALLRGLPNALSIFRIAASPLLVVLALMHWIHSFTWILVLALISDMIDGSIARALKVQSELGAKLDSFGDLLLTPAALFGMWAFFPEVCRDHWPALALFLGAGLLEYALSMLRYGKLSSFHTIMSKTAGTLLAIYIAVLFIYGFVPWLFYLAIGSAIVASLEEYVLLAMLPEWRANVRGVAWLLRERRG